MSIISGCSKKISALALAVCLLTPPPALWAQVVQTQAPQAAASGVSGVGGVVKVYPVQLGQLNVAVPSSLAGIPGLSAAPSVKTVSRAAAALSAAPAAAPAALHSAAGAAMAVERHPVLEILNGLQRAGVVLPEKLDTLQDLAKLRAAAEALPEGSARRDIMAFVESVSAAKGSEASASGKLFDNDGVKIVADDLMPSAVAPEAQGAWARISKVANSNYVLMRPIQRLLPFIGRYAARKAEASRFEAIPINTTRLEVPAERLRWSPKDEDLPASTAELAATDHQVVGQDRALRALLFGLKMGGPQYNVVVTGPSGSGRETAVRHILSELAPTMPTPGDMVAVTNVADKDKPIVLNLPTGAAPAFQKEVQKFFTNFMSSLPQTLQSGSAAEVKAHLQKKFQEAARMRQLELEEAAAKIAIGPGNRFGLSVGIEQAEEGVKIMLVPTLGGVPLHEDSLGALIAEGKVTRSEWALVQKALEEVSPPIIAQAKAMLMENQQEYQALAQQLAMADGRAAAALVNKLIRPVMATISAPVSHDDDAHKQLEAKREEMKAKVQEQYGSAESGPFKVAIHFVETTQGYSPAVEIFFEGEALEGFEALEQFVAEGKVAQKDVDALMEKLEGSVEAYAKAMSKVAQDFKQEHAALHANDPEPDADTQRAIGVMSMFFSAVASNYQDFLPSDDDGKGDPREAYQVSVLAANRPDTGAPVLYVGNPTYENLFGSAERKMTLAQTVAGVVPVEAPGGPRLKSGAFQRANGGFLILNLEDVVQEPGVWPALAKALRSGGAAITDDGLKGFAERGGAYAVPSNVKVVLMGSPMLKMMLEHYDESFRGLFGVLAEFDSALKISAAAIESYLDFMKNAVVRSAGELLDLTRGAIRKVMEYGAKLTGSNESLSMQFGAVRALLAESSFYAKQSGHDLVQAEDVEQALRERSERDGAGVRRYRETIENNVFMAATDGSVVGQINGLAVVGEFGVPKRITVAVSAGSGQVVSWDKNAGSVGTSFNKALGVVQGFLNNTFAKSRRLPVDVQISFEQNYGGIDGDSATSTKIYATLSALSGVPIYQGIAVTGSSDQFGNVQAIGGANEKVTGVFLLAKARGLNGKQGVIIPASNIRELNLSPEIVQAVREGKFHIWGVEHVSQGIEILTGVAYSEILRKARLNIDRIGGR